MEDKGSIGIFLGFSLIAFFGHIFYAWWQTYVMLLDIVVASSGAIFVAGGLLAGIVELISLPTMM